MKQRNTQDKSSSCLLDKQARHSFPQATTYHADNLLDLIHGDLCGPITLPTPKKKRYIFVLIDDHSRYMWSILLKEKGEAFEKFKKFKTMVEQETWTTIKTFRTDRGGEFISTEFQSFCESSGILRHLTAHYTPKHNRVVERRNKTLLDMTRSILKHMECPNYLRGETVRHANYLIKRVGTRVLVSKSPYEAFKNKRPNVEHIRVFWCVGCAKVDSPHLKKLDNRSRALVHLGTEPGSKAYRLYDPTTRKVSVSRDVIFDENKMWNWRSSTEEVTVPGAFEIKFNEFGNRGINKNKDIVGNADEEGDNTEIPTVEEEQDINDRNEESLRRSTREKKKHAYLDDYIQLTELESERLLLTINDEPWDYNEAKEKKVWRDACEDEIVSIVKNKTWELVELPVGAKAIGLKWIFKVKCNADGSINKFKAKLVAKGYIQRHGIDYDEVFAPMTRIETVRFLIALAASRGWENHHLDVKTAFLHGDLKEEVYVFQPEGLVVKGNENKVYKLKKVLYGLRQAPRAWNEKLNKMLGSLNFVKCSKEPAIYRKQEEDHIILVAVYVMIF